MPVSIAFQDFQFIIQGKEKKKNEGFLVLMGQQETPQLRGFLFISVEVLCMSDAARQGILMSQRLNILFLWFFISN